MTIDAIVDPVLFVNDAPIVGFKGPDSNPPKARSTEDVAPKIYVSPVLDEPVPAA